MPVAPTRLASIATFALGGCVLAAGCARQGPAYAPRPPGVAALVAMTDTFSFSPETVRVRAGDTVEWRNTSVASHTVTDEPAGMKDAGEVSLPPGAEGFSSGGIGRGQVWRHTFAVPGTYRYFYLPHHDIFGMRGTVEVDP